MEPSALREFEMKLQNWIGQGYEIFADDIDGQLRVTTHFVSGVDGRSSERDQEFWPMAPEIVEMLEGNDIHISKALAGPRPWAGPHPDHLDEIEERVG